MFTLTSLRANEFFNRMKALCHGILQAFTFTLNEPHVVRQDRHSRQRSPAPLRASPFTQLLALKYPAELRYIDVGSAAKRMEAVRLTFKRTQVRFRCSCITALTSSTTSISSSHWNGRSKGNMLPRNTTVPYKRYRDPSMTMLHYSVAKYLGT